MTVAEKIKRSTKPLSGNRWILSLEECIARTILMNSRRCRAAVFTFIDGSKLTCRIYW